MRSVRQQSDDIKRLAILAPSLLPLPQESNHGIAQLVLYCKISIQQTGSMDFLLQPPAPTPQSYLPQSNSVNSSKKKRIRKLPCDGGNVVSYHTHNVQGLSAAIVHYHTSPITDIYS